MGQQYASFLRSNFFDSFEYVNNVESDLFSDLFLFKNVATQKPVFVQEIPLDVVEQKSLEKYANKYHISHRYILDIYNIFSISGAEWKDAINLHDDDNIANNELVCIMIFEYYEYDLAREIQAKVNDKTRYSEQSLWRMLKELFSALAECQEKGIPNGQISTERIFIDMNGDFQLSIVQPLVNHIKTGNSQLSKFKQDTYDLGLCVLQCCQLDKYVSKDDWRSNFDDIRQYYSPEFCNFLSACLNEDSVARPAPLDMHVTYQGHLCLYQPHTFNNQDIQKLGQIEQQKYFTNNGWVNPLVGLGMLPKTTYQAPMQSFNGVTYNSHQPFNGQNPQTQTFNQLNPRTQKQVMNNTLPSVNELDFKQHHSTNEFPISPRKIRQQPRVEEVHDLESHHDDDVSVHPVQPVQPEQAPILHAPVITVSQPQPQVIVNQPLPVSSRRMVQAPIRTSMIPATHYQQPMVSHQNVHRLPVIRQSQRIQMPLRTSNMPLRTSNMPVYRAPTNYAPNTIVRRTLAPNMHNPVMHQGNPVMHQGNPVIRRSPQGNPVIRRSIVNTSNTNVNDIVNKYNQMQ